VCVAVLLLGASSTLHRDEMSLMQAEQYVLYTGVYVLFTTSVLMVFHVYVVYY
jgi:hypothetical protein